MPPFTVNLGIKDLERKLADLRTYDAQTQAKLCSAVETSTTNIMLGAKRRVPVKSGDLVKSISMTYDSARNIGIIKAKSPYAHLVEYGAKAVHETPDTKKALKIGDRFAASANIPVRKEHPFMRPAYENEKPNLINSVETAIKP